jgi:transposase
MSRRKPKLSRSDPAAQALLETLNPHAAGIDVGATELWVAVLPGSVPPQAQASDTPAAVPANVHCFGTFTADLEAIARWLRQCGVTTVAMESTGVYWIPLYDLLESAGFQVLLVDPRQVQRTPNRPEERIRVWRSYQRHRANLIADAGRHLQRMHKALEQMNLKLTEVVSDLTGVTGMGIIKAILQGERDPKALAKLRDRRCQESAQTIALALQGRWREEHLFELKQSLELYQYYHQQIGACDQVIEAHLKTLALAEVEPLPSRPHLRK